MSAHTQGQWITNGGVVRTADENNITIRRIALVMGDIGDPEKLANAQLIAAAPDLLGAIERVATLAAPGQELGISDAVDLICDILNIARAAIARASLQSPGDDQ